MNDMNGVHDDACRQMKSSEARHATWTDRVQASDRRLSAAAVRETYACTATRRRGEQAATARGAGQHRIGAQRVIGSPRA